MRALTLSTARHDAIPRTLMRTTLRTIDPNLAESHFCRLQGERARSRSPCGVEVLSHVVGQPSETGAVGVCDVNFGPFLVLGGESDASAVRGPRRGPVIVALGICQASPSRAIRLHGVDFPLILGREGDLLSVGRPDRLFLFSCGA